MATQTYCTTADLEAILGKAGVQMLLDDNEDGTANTLEASYATDAIEQAASQMNALLNMRYTLSALASSDWCKWCNAYLALEFLERRRGNPLSQGYAVMADQYRQALQDIRNGRMRVPDSVVAKSVMPAVSNYTTDLSKQAPVRVNLPISERPGADNIRRNTSYGGGWL